VALASQLNDPETFDYVDTLTNFSLATPERQLQRLRSGKAASSSLAILRGVVRVTSLLILGRIPEADDEIVSFSDLVRRSRSPQASWYADLMLATRAHMDGRYQEAKQLASRYLMAGNKYGDRNAIHSYEAQGVMRAFDAGGVAVYESRVRAMVKAFPRMVAWRGGLLLILLELGRLDEARVELGRIMAHGPVGDLPMNEWYVTVGALSLACGVLGDQEIGAKLYDELKPHAEQLVVFGYCTYCLGSTHRLLAALATGMREWHVARAHFELAAAKNIEIGAIACNAPVFFEFARMLKTAGDESEAMKWAAEAERLASRFAMGRLAERASGLAKSCPRSI
jgi:tetratricopeptide (TPR) repeat protein